jgi:regulatory protein
MAFGALSLKGRALRHLARRDHSRAELERKLAPFAQEPNPDLDPEPGQDPDPDPASASASSQIAAALDELAAKGLQSDQRTAESLITGQSRRLGVYRLKQNLKAKGLGAELINSALAQAHAQGMDSELERARGLWQRRFGEPAADPAGRAKQMRFLAGRGFSGDVVRRVLQEARDGVEEGSAPDF